MTATTALTALARGVAVHEATLGALGPLLDAARVWHDQAGSELGTVLHADDDSRQRASEIVNLASEAHADLLRLVMGTQHRLTTLRETSC